MGLNFSALRLRVYPKVTKILYFHTSFKFESNCDEVLASGKLWTPNRRQMVFKRSLSVVEFTLAIGVGIGFEYLHLPSGFFMVRSQLKNFDIHQLTNYECITVVAQTPREQKTWEVFGSNPASTGLSSSFLLFSPHNKSVVSYIKSHDGVAF